MLGYTIVAYESVIVMTYAAGKVKNYFEIFDKNMSLNWMKYSGEYIRQKVALYYSCVIDESLMKRSDCFVTLR